MVGFVRSYSLPLLLALLLHLVVAAFVATGVVESSEGCRCGETSSSERKPNCHARAS